MTIRAVDLPEVRAELSSFAGSAEGVSYWEEHATTLDYYRSRELDADYLGAVTQESLSGPLFAVTSAMAELAAAAGQSLDLFDMGVEDLPAPTGLLVFEDPPHLLQGVDADGAPTVVHGATWVVRDDGQGPYVWITAIAVTAGYDGLTLGGPALIPFSMAQYLESVGASMTRDKNLFDYLMTTLRAAWLLMRQPLAESSEVLPNRAVRKRLSRMGYEPALVRLIELRRPRTASGEMGGGREYHHQWIVRGHWRQQWHPKRQVHRPVWIAPHVKGPDGAPLIGGEKVNVLKR
ncbi:hypothetical protein ABZ438_07900 [Streptomyces sp. NPDC005786]|uniref:hypothetical protein n=1 Tax=Streptomyces sp. NPDC005786 TaxID=3154891 RepID=UPI0033E274E7